jgi:hypothetical protein
MRPSVRLWIRLLCSVCLLPGLWTLDQAALGGDEDIQMSPALRESVDRGLRFLVDTQQADGSWSSASYGRNVGENALALMAFMAQGNLPGEGPYADTVARAVHWLVAQQQPSGLIQYTQQTRQAPVMYGHALATLALSEVWGHTRDRGEDAVGATLRRAVDLIVQVQGPRGGWHYQSTPRDGDTSVCVMQIMALKSAQQAGIFVPSDTIGRAIRLIKTRYDHQRHGYGYNNDTFHYHHLGSSAAGTCIMLVTGEQDPTYTLEPLEKLIATLEHAPDRIHWHFYYAYYTSICSYLAGDAVFKRWVAALEPWLLDQQLPDGSWSTSTVSDTAFGILAAAMPFRYLPVYQR